jgi:hypothetical protein
VRGATLSAACRAAILCDRTLHEEKILMLHAPRTAIAALLCAAMATPAAANVMTADGRTPPHAPAPRSPARAPSGAVPYAAAPDWSNTLRVQVGGLAFGDLDGDGRDDLAVGTYHSNSFPPYDDWHDYVYFNVGGALEAEPSWQSADQHHTGAVAIGDVDGDGIADLVAVRGGFSFDPSVVYYGAPGGLATSAGWQSAVSAWGVGGALVDIDGDGDLDLVTANQGNSQDDAYRPLYLFRNDGHGLATTPDWQSAQAAIENSVAAADLDGDGLPDLATAKWVDFESAAYLNVGGTPATTPFWNAGTTDGDRGVAIADFDGDGRNDILLGQATLTLYHNDGAGGFAPVWHADNTESDHQGLAVGDIDGDGWPDIAEIDFARGKVSIYMNRDGVLDTLPDWSYDGDGAGTALAFGDVDGDGQTDLAVGFSGQPSVVVFLNTGVPVDDTIFADGFEPPA